MKKVIALVLTVFIIFTLAACRADGDTENGNLANGSSSGGTQTNNTSIRNAAALLKNIWDSYGDDERFSVVGGDYSEENHKMGEPGNFSLEDATALDSSLGFPAASISNIDEAASLIHMMNGNTFTCGAFHIKDSRNTSIVTAAIRKNIQSRQWICGFPDKLVIANIDDYVVAMFGKQEVIDTFKSKMTDVYPNTEIICEEIIE